MISRYRSIDVSSHTLSPAPKLRKRLWQAGLALALFIATLAIGNGFVPADKAVSRKSAGHDFLAFYTAGAFVRTGRAAELYDIPTIAAAEQELARHEGLELRDDQFGPYWNPPFFACVFAPLSALPYQTAWTVWFAMNLICAGAAIAILSRLIARRSADWRDWALAPLLIVVSMPFIQALGHGQNTCVSLLLLTITVDLWRSDRALAAGVACGLLFYKPQLGAVVAAALVLSPGWRSIAGLAIAGTSLFAFNLIALPGTLSRFLQQLGPNVAFMQVEHKYMWDRHVTLKAFWRLLMQGFAAGELTPMTRTLYLISVLAVAACLVATIWKLRRRTDDMISRDRLIAATILAMPLLMPFYFDYDLLLLAVPAVLAAREHVGGQTIDRPLLFGWVALFAWQFVSPAVAGATHVNGTVPILAGVAAMAMHRAWRASEQLAIESSESIHPPLRHAA